MATSVPRPEPPTSSVAQPAAPPAFWFSASQIQDDCCLQGFSDDFRDQADVELVIEGGHKLQCVPLGHPAAALPGVRPGLEEGGLRCTHQPASRLTRPTIPCICLAVISEGLDIRDNCQ